MKHVLKNTRFPRPVLEQMYAWRDYKGKEFLEYEQALDWLNFELKTRRTAFNKSYKEECPFERPLEECMEKGILPNSKPKKKLHVQIYEYFYLTKEDYEDRKSVV